MRLRFICIAVILSVIASFLGHKTYKDSQYKSEVYFSYSGQCKNIIYVIDHDNSEIIGFFKLDFVEDSESTFKHYRVDGTIQKNEGIYIFDFNDGKPPARVKKDIDGEYISVEEENYYFNKCNNINAEALIKIVLRNI
jgi:hypothetical protein